MSQIANCKVSIGRQFVGVLLLLLSGCGRGGPDVAPVNGHVTLDGRPLVGADIEFLPEDGRPPASGRTDQEGYYELLYKRGVIGAPVGKNTVRISFYRNAVANPPNVPERYNKQSELHEEVKSGPNELNFDLTTEKK